MNTMSALRARFPAPANESAILKNVPIAMLNEVREVLRAEGIKTRVMFRGPRYSVSRGFCLKSDALRFAVYKA